MWSVGCRQWRWYTCQLFLIYKRDILYFKGARIFKSGPIISEEVRRYSEDFRRCYEGFRLTRTWEHKGTLTSLLKKENSEKVDHSQRLFLSLFSSGFLEMNYKYIFQNVSVNAVMAQTFPPGVTNQNTDVSRREIQLFDPQVYDGSLGKHFQPRTPSASKSKCVQNHLRSFQA